MLRLSPEALMKAHFFFFFKRKSPWIFFYIVQYYLFLYVVTVLVIVAWIISLIHLTWSHENIRETSWEIEKLKMLSLWNFRFCFSTGLWLYLVLVKSSLMGDILNCHKGLQQTYLYNTNLVASPCGLRAKTWNWPKEHWGKWKYTYFICGRIL